MSRFPELAENASRAELTAWFDAAEKKINDLLIIARAREKAKKKKTRKAK